MAEPEPTEQPVGDDEVQQNEAWIENELRTLAGQTGQQLQVHGWNPNKTVEPYRLSATIAGVRSWRSFPREWLDDAVGDAPDEPRAKIRDVLREWLKAGR